VIISTDEWKATLPKRVRELLEEDGSTDPRWRDFMRTEGGKPLRFMSWELELLRCHGEKLPPRSQWHEAALARWPR
jgi:hypothetical protein